MSKPLNEQTHSATTATGASEPVRSKGHSNVGLIVGASNYDSANDSVEAVVEVSADGSTWTPLRRNDGSEVKVTLGTEDAKYAMVNGAPGDHLRVNVTTLTDSAGGDLTVDTWILLAGWNGPSFGA